MSAPDLLPGATVDGRWRIVELLGADGDARSYLAEPVAGGKPVRIVLLDERCARSRELAARFDREARALSRVDHRYCVSILAFGIDHGRPYLVTQNWVGRRLSDELSAAPLAPARAARLASQLLEGLRHGHAHGVNHRQLSPDNLLLLGAAGGPDHIKILDFGMARIAGSDGKRRAESGYLAPEQLRNGVVDARADLFAVGAILQAMLSGRLQPAEVALGELPASPSLRQVVARAQSSDPERRFADAGEMLAALAATVEGRAGTGRGPVRRGRALIGSVTIVALLFTLGVLWLSTRPKPPVAVSPPVIPRAAPPVTARTAPVAIAAPAAVPTDAAPVVPAPTAPVLAGDAARTRSEALLAGGRLDEAEAALHAQLAAHPDRAELHLELAEVYDRRFWRRDAVAEWDRALALDPRLAGDARFATRLCAILGPRWSNADELIERRLGRSALPALVACAASVTDLARLQAATRLVERIGGPGLLDPQWVARRTLELSTPR